MSGAPIMSGTIQFPKPPIIAGSNASGGILGKRSEATEAPRGPRSHGVTTLRCQPGSVVFLLPQNGYEATALAPQLDRHSPLVNHEPNTVAGYASHVSPQFGPSRAAPRSVGHRPAHSPQEKLPAHGWSE
jgi:hypothetical protein